MALALVKQALRAELRAALSQVGVAERAAQAERVARALLAEPEVVPGAAIATFVGVGEELDTGPLRAALHARGAIVLVPRIVGRGQQVFAVERSLGDLIAGRFGIPTGGGPDWEGPIALCVVPGLAFDGQGGRLGQGGGYYDRWLSAHPEVPRIGVCLSVQRRASLPREAHDVPITRLICG